MGKLAITQETMLYRFISFHGLKYDYTKSKIGKNSKEKVIITCKVHGDFEQSPVKHWSGQGCIECKYAALSESMQSSTEDFTTKSVARHGQSYGYHLVDYVRSDEDVEIFCNRHNGSFWQTPSQHLAGSGCSQCADYGYKEGHPGFVYILKCGEILKVGITNRDSDAREKKISSSYGEKFIAVWKMKFSEGKYPRIIERSVLKMLKKTYGQPKEIFDGSTECFTGVSVEDVIDVITQETRLAFEQNNWRLI